MSAAEQITLSSIIRRRDGLSTQEVDDTLVVTDDSGAWCYGLEFVARGIWQLLDCPRTVSDLCGALVDGYDIDRETCSREVLEFVRELSREDLIEVL